MTINLDEIERIAREATPGPWRAFTSAALSKVEDNGGCWACNRPGVLLRSGLFDDIKEDGWRDRTESPGLWHYHLLFGDPPDNDPPYGGLQIHSLSGVEIAGHVIDGGGIMSCAADAAHIATMNPAATLELVARIRELEAQLAEADRLIDWYANSTAPDMPEGGEETETEACARHRAREGK